MKVLMVMFDSLNRHMLSPYGCDWTHTPNFQRLAQKTVTFDNSYVCSMPCMPARRELHTGRPNFLHRSWGPLEPYDDSCVAALKNAGHYTHMVTDHQHYWEEGSGGNYLSKYNTHEMIRGQEGDPWYPMLQAPAPTPDTLGRNAAQSGMGAQDRINRTQFTNESKMPQAMTFERGMDFLSRYGQEDNWFLQIETFDPHEPFFSQRKYKDLYADFYNQARKRLWDWPGYAPVAEDDDVEWMRHEYAALLSMCDAYMGDVLDKMDEQNLWEDTLLVVWTDHGFVLGEHDSWAKCWLPFYDEIAHTPFFMWDPRVGKSGERRSALVQPSIDLAPTLLEAFGHAPSPYSTGQSLKPVLENDTPIRQTGIFGIFGGQVNITDGRYVYMRGPASEANTPLNEYTLMPSHMRQSFQPEELQHNELADPFTFTKGIKTVKIPSKGWGSSSHHPDIQKTLLYDLKEDPGQQNPITDPTVEQRMIAALKEHMKSLDAPAEQYERLGL